MKKNTLFLLFGLMTCFSYSQIGLVENFDGGLVLPAGWTTDAGDYFGTVIEVCDGFSQRSNFSDTNTTGHLTSLNVAGQSNATDLTIAFDYKIVDWSAATNPTAPGWGVILVQYSTNDGGVWNTIGIIDDGTHVTSNVCANVEFTVPAASLPLGSDFKLRLETIWAAGDYYTYIDNVVASQVVVDPPSCVNILVPTNGATGVSINTDLDWSAATGIPTGTVVSVGTTSGGTDVIDNQEVGLSTTLILPTLEYSTTYFVNIIPYNDNGNALNCTEFTFTTGADPNAPVDCSAGTPVNTVYCYVDNETITWNFESSDGSPLNVFFNAGQFETCCDDIIIYDGIDNTGTVLFSDGLADMVGVSVNAPSGFVFIEIQSDGSVSCDANGFTPIDFDVSCIDATAVPNCNASITSPINGDVDVNENADITWGAASIIVTGYTISIGTTPGGTDIADNVDVGNVLNYDPGTLPYETIIYVTIVPYNDNGPAINCTEESFTVRNDPNQIVDCSINEVINTTYCYGPNDTMQFNFASSDGSPLVVVFNAGQVENTWDELVVLDSDGVTDLNAGTPYGNAGDLTGIVHVSSGSTLTVGVTSDGVNSCSNLGYVEWDFDVSCVDTTALPNCNAVLTAPANGDIDVNENDDLNWSPATIFVTGYTISIGTTPGGTDIVDNVDIGNVTTYDPGTLDYSTTYYVTIVPYNDNGPATGCTEESFTTRDDPNQVVDCSIDEVINTVYCYTNNDTMQFNFASSDGSPLVVVFNSGTTENNFDELIVLDSDGTTNLNAATPYGNGGDLTGLVFVSSGSTVTVGVTSDGSVVSCAGDPWNFDVSCLDTTAVPNCNSVLTAPTNGDIGVNENDDIFWSPATIFVTGYNVSMGTTPGGTDIADNVDVGDVQTYDPGTLPYNTTIYVTITPYNDNGPATGCIEESFTVRPDPNVIVDCDAGAVNTVYCYENNDAMEFYFTSSSGFPLVIEFNAGEIEAGWDEVIILDSDGTSVLYQGDNGGFLGGVTATSTGDMLTVVVDSDGVNSCDANGFEPWDFDVYCLTCLPQTVEFNINGDCDTDPDNPEFTVDVDITDLGDATTLTITDDQGSPPQDVTATGVVTMGPYPASMEIFITVANTDDVNCVIESPSLIFLCPPAPNPCSIVYAGPDAEVDCTNQDTDLTATFHLFGQDTNVYEINALDGCPLPANTGGIPTSLAIDDTWSSVLDMEFEFCFFGETYNQLIVGSNGVISFEIENAETGNGWQMDPDDTLPNNTNDTLGEANIFGVGHDIDPSVCGDINYVILGSAPARQFVVNFTNVCHFQCNDLMSSSQIILYESSNAIDVNVFDKPTCDTWNDGNAVIGVQNIDGTVAFTPPGRNTGSWTATDESWRFSPAQGAPNYTFEWFDGATSIGNTETITVSPTVPTTYTASVTYNLCTGGTATVTDNVFVDVTGVEPTITDPMDLEVCDDDNDGFAEFDLCSQDAIILGGQTGLTVTYHETQADSETGASPLTCLYTNTTPNIQTIYVRVEDDTNACFKLSTFNIIVNPLPIANTPPDMTECDNDGDGSAEFDLDSQTAIVVGGQTDVVVTYHDSEANAIAGTGALSGLYESGAQTIYIRIENTITGCFSTTMFELILGESPDTSFDPNAMYEICPNASTPIDVTAIANNYTLSEVSITWYQDGDLVSGVNGLTIPVLEAGTYDIEVTFNDTGCSAMESVVVIESDNCIIPQVITPNNDGSNDFFDLSSFDVSSLEIFNRHGIKVYSKINYTNDWYGQSDGGDELPVGTYFYVMRYEGNKVRTSWVYINK